MLLRSHATETDVVVRYTGLELQWSFTLLKVCILDTWQCK